MQRLNLLPGEMAFRVDGASITTILGSCVAVTCWDRQCGWGGMNHYLLPRQLSPHIPPGKCGDRAIRQLLTLARRSGSRRRDLVIGLYGGANSTGDHCYAVGDANLSMARRLLAALGLRVAHEDVGGSRGRHVTFETGTGAVGVRFVSRSPPPAATSAAMRG